jgi:hypothetical protein
MRRGLQFTNLRKTGQEIVSRASGANKIKVFQFGVLSNATGLNGKFPKIKYIQGSVFLDLEKL